MDRRDFLSSSLLAAAGVSHAGVASERAAAGTATRAWEIGPRGDFDTMRFVDRQLAAPGYGQAVVSITHSSLAARDLAIARGWFLQDKPADLVPLSEGVGVVTEVSREERRIKKGDRVICAHFANWVDGPWTPANYAVDIGNTVDGWLAKDALLPTAGLARVPDGVTNETAATLSGSAVTAWNALHEVSQVRPGETVLTLGTGGVSTWGLLLAKAAGAKVAITSSSDEKLAQMRQLGADVTVNYRTNPEWGKAIHEATGGVDVVLENVGRPTLDQSMLASGNNARIVMIGTGPLPKKLPAMPGFYIKNLMMKAISNGSRKMLEDLLQAIAANNIEAVIAKRFALADAPQAFEFMAKSGHSGKVLITHR